MSPDELAALHHAAFTTDRPWSATEFTALLNNRFTALIPHPNGFALTRTLAGETELLTLAVAPAHQRKGIARTLVKQWLKSAQPLAERAFLEVAADNIPAIAVYQDAGFVTCATRTAYYTRKTAAPADALVMQRSLTHG